MPSSWGSSQVRVTVLSETSAVSPVGAAGGSGVVAAGVVAFTQLGDLAQPIGG